MGNRDDVLWHFVKLLDDLEDRETKETEMIIRMANGLEFKIVVLVSKPRLTIVKPD